VPNISTDTRIILWVIAAIAGGLSAIVGNVLAINIVYLFSRKGRRPTQRSARVWITFLGSLSVSIVFGALAAFAPVEPNENEITLTSTSDPVAEKEQADLLYTSAQNWKIIFFDTFSNNDAKWEVGELTDTFVETRKDVTTGTYNWWVKATGYGGLRLTMAPAATSDTIYVAVDGKVVDYTKTVAYGIAFRCQGINRYYHIRFYLEKDSFAIKYRDKNKDVWETLAYLPHTKIEPGEWNRIALIAKDSDYWFYLNGNFIYHLQDDRLSGGSVGLLAGVENIGDEATIEFDNFEYRSTP